MLKKIKLSLIAVFAFSFLTVPVLAVGSTAYAQDNQIQQGLCEGADLKFGGDTTCESGNANEDSLNALIAKIINIISVIVGIVAVIMIIYGGFKYITSGGDSGNVTGAKNTILYAIVGLIIVALAQFIVKFVLNTGSSAVNG